MVRNEHDKAENYRCRSYIYAPDGHGFSPLAQLNGRGRGGQIYYYFNDQLGTPQELVTVNGDIVWSAVYKSYGNLAVEYQSVPQPIRLPGQYFDEESGLHYNRYRYYDPYSARYFSQDPAGLEGGENAYSYVSNPLTYIDPLGLTVCKVYRQISGEDLARLKQGLGIKPKGIGGSIVAHVEGTNTGHISASLKKEAIERFSTENGLIEIDVKKAIRGGAKFIDHNNVMQAVEKSGSLRNRRDAKRALEVLFKGEIPFDAIKIIGK